MRTTKEESEHKGHQMNISIPPYNAQFFYMNAIWETIGWAKKVEGEYVSCRSDDATFVIGRRLGGSAPTIAPVEDVSNASRNRNWKYSAPAEFRHGEPIEIGKRVDVIAGRLVFP